MLSSHPSAGLRKVICVLCVINFVEIQQQIDLYVEMKCCKGCASFGLINLMVDLREMSNSAAQLRRKFWANIYDALSVYASGPSWRASEFSWGRGWGYGPNPWPGI